MGLLDFVFGSRKEAVPTEIQGQTIKVVEIGSTGTEIYSGYIHEEYLAELTGSQWSDKIDQIRRSDANVKMTINALKLPLKSGNWRIIPKEESELAEMQKKLIEKALFEDINKSFTKLLGEILTCLEFGYSLFDITFRPKLDDKEMGPYNTLKSISYRSQRTIDKWNIDESGNLKSVTQIANGDLGVMVDMDARFLLHFAPEQEGDNFEGVSVIRSMYGNWLRKNHYLKLMAAGIEKYAIPVPVLTVPDGKENSPEYRNALKTLKCYTSNQNNYLTKPAGWDLEIKPVTFDAETIRTVIDSENKEMVNSILASFLLLGQGGSGGAYALSNDLSDFFGQTLQYLADHISEQFERKIFTPLVKMNFGDVPVMVELRCDSLAEKPDKVWAETLKILTDSGVVTKDRLLEDFVREKYKLPESPNEALPMPGSVQAVSDVASSVADTSKTIAETKQLAEKKSKKKRPQSEAVDKIYELAGSLKDFFKTNLKKIGADYVQRVINEKSKLPSASQLKAPLNVKVPDPSYYTEGIKYLLTISTMQAQDDVLSLASKKKKLSEFRLASEKTAKVEAAMNQAAKAFKDLEAGLISEQLFAEKIKKARQAIEEAELDYDQIQRIAAKADTLVGTQLGDIDKAVSLQYSSSFSSTDSDSILAKDMTEKMNQVVDGPMTSTGPDILASQTINEARDDAAESLGEEVISYTFVAVDDDKTTDICLELDGRTFAVNDPDLDRYTPPLHYNCRSYMAINLASFKGNPEITSDSLSLSKKAQGQINLSEKHKCCDAKDAHTSFVMSLKKIKKQT